MTESNSITRKFQVATDDREHKIGRASYRERVYVLV